MPKLPTWRGSELIRKLQRIGFEIDHTTGSHVVMRNPVTHRRAIVPSHRRPIPRGTIASMLREAGIDWRDLL
ncbi:type II toxin-antitoxin system HicA family toxin [Candidatus Uhrbacteria bacterium]|nr:type II toxin-antitoxin system HicA family toxin [Candidatus Uhrbacteria bacterium]